MKKNIHITLAATSFLLLANFSGQDSGNGTTKPAVNFFGTITDASDMTFEAENITLERLYKQIPAYQLSPKNLKDSKDQKNEIDSKDAYDPAVNITRLNLAEIDKIVIDTNQIPEKHHSRDYIIIDVYSKMVSNNSHEPQVKNSYLIEANKKVTCDETNPNIAGTIEKEIMLKAIKTIGIKGFKSNSSDDDKNKKTTKTSASSKYASKSKQIMSYIENLFSVNPFAS